jgi:hypothetical protein
VNERIDEEIGALLDGRVPEPRRTELLTRLAADDADYDVFADTAAVLREAEEEGSAAKESVVDSEVVRETKVIPLRPRRASGWRSPAVRSLAAAAVLATTVLVPVLRTRMIANRWRSPEHLYAALATPGAQLPQPVGVKRGGGPEADGTGTAARLGIMHMDMVVLVNAGDTAQASLLAGEAAALLGNVGGAGEVATAYTQVRDSTQWERATVLDRLAAARVEAAELTDPDYFALGAWTEAARLAANQRDAAFFTERGRRKALEQAVSLEGLNDDAKAAATRLLAVQEQGTIQDWTSVSSDLAALQRGLMR